MKQTAVEWLENELADNLKTIILKQDYKLMEYLFNEAKQMEQEQMELATWDTTLTDGIEEIEWDTKPGFVEKRMALRAQSAKNKAEKLISKYNLVVLDTALGGSNQRAKECASIAVDEIINTLNSDIRDLDVRGNILLDLIDYWREVKQEIEKL